MLTSDFLRIRGTPEITSGQDVQVQHGQAQQQTANGSTFAEELRQRIAAQNGFAEPVRQPTTAEQLEIMSGINFSRHAVERINSRQIDVMSDNRLQRLSRGMELAESKGSDDALVIVDTTAFVVNVPGNKVITAVEAGDVQGNVFTNIDTAVIM
ncbi:MAG: flagellar protein [Oscillospiraceae bacterium]|nr:flagellar protein [Oscillospiraceae bacterium]